MLIQKGEATPDVTRLWEKCDPAGKVAMAHSLKMARGPKDLSRRVTGKKNQENAQN